MGIKFSEMKLGTLSSLLGDPKKPIILIGAGCSVKSGIPTASELVGKIAKWGYARENAIPPDIGIIRQSDWLPWLESKRWYQTELSFADNYPAVVDNILRPRAARKDFLLEVLNPQIPPSKGYEKLSDLIGLKVFETVLTTNFDSLIDDSCRQNKSVHAHYVIKNKDEIVKITTNPNYPQIIHLHGDIETYTDKNLVEEVETLDQDLVDRIIPLIRDHPLIVIGYRGAENSVMQSLLSSQVEKADKFPNGIYWCHYDMSPIEDLPQNVTTLSNLIGSNFQLIQTPSFEDIIDELWYHYEHNVRNSLNNNSNNLRPTVNDFQVLKDINLSHLDEIVMNTRIVNYCRALNVWIPEEQDKDWLLNFQLERDLISKENEEKNEYHPTYAGYLLFGRNVPSILKHAQIRVIIEQNPVWLNKIFGNDDDDVLQEIQLESFINGNLWEQLDAITDLLSQFNKPFRLKGEISKDVLPYPPLALKELLVNAIAHRDYTSKNPIDIVVSPISIQIRNPGGLMPGIIKELGSGSILSKISEGGRGFKSYRNPVIADFFYGSGAMDKAGSGLADVFDLVMKVKSKVTFGPTEDNSNFIAEIFARPESINAMTNTATDDYEGITTFVGNLLEVISMPRFLYSAITNENMPEKIWEKHYDDFLPPFLFYQGRIMSFYPLDSKETPLTMYIEKETLEEIDLEDYGESLDNERVIVRLLNKNIESHLRSIGLVVDHVRKRAYFPMEDPDQNRTMSYQARIKKATRTVSKRIISKKDDQILYWEHKSFSYHFKRFGKSWALVLLPGYVFTRNGEKWLLRHEKISRLATKRSSIDYNKSVLNDLYFWINVISKDRGSNFWLDCDGKTEKYSEAKIIGLSANYPEYKQAHFGEQEGLEGADFDELERIENELTQIIEGKN